MIQNEEERSDLSYEPVEGFLRNEALSRFPIGGVPTSLFDWKPLSEQLQSAPSHAEERRTEEEHPDQSPLIESQKESSDKESSDEARSRLERRREKMIAEAWSQLSDFYDRNGYKALHELRESLNRRAQREQDRIALHHERVEYLSTLEADLRDCMNEHGEDATVEKAFQEGGSSRRTEWSQPYDHRGSVELSLPESMLEKRGVDPDNLRRYPWSIEMETPLGEVFMELHRTVESEKERVVELGDLLGLIRLRLRLLGRKLWTIDLGLPAEGPPTPSTIPEEFQGRERAVQYCWMILSVIGELGPEWPSQPELSDVLAEYYDFESPHVRLESMPEYASDFIREEFSDAYGNFRPDFYRILQDRSDLFEFLAREMDTDLLDQINAPT